MHSLKLITQLSASPVPNGKSVRKMAPHYLVYPKLWKPTMRIAKAAKRSSRKTSCRQIAETAKLRVQKTFKPRGPTATKPRVCKMPTSRIEKALTRSGGCTRRSRHEGEICKAPNRHGSPSTNQRWQNRKAASAKAAKQQSEKSSKSRIEKRGGRA